MRLPFGLTGIWGWVAAGLAALALVAAITVGVRGCKQTESDADNVLIDLGVTKERAAEQGKVIEDVKQAQDAVANPTSDERNVVCEKYDRNCKNSQ